MLCMKETFCSLCGSNHIFSRPVLSNHTPSSLFSSNLTPQFSVVSLFSSKMVMSWIKFALMENKPVFFKCGYPPCSVQACSHQILMVNSWLPPFCLFKLFGLFIHNSLSIELSREYIASNQFLRKPALITLNICSISDYEVKSGKQRHDNFLKTPKMLSKAYTYKRKPMQSRSECNLLRGVLMPYSLHDYLVCYKKTVFHFLLLKGSLSDSGSPCMSLWCS